MDKVETLKKNYEFKNVLNKGKFYIKNQIIVYITKNKKEKNFIGIAINTKICNAVKRNRIKRLIKENYRLIQKNLEQGFNIIFLINKKVSIDEVNFFEIRQEMYNIFKEANILKKEE